MAIGLSTQMLNQNLSSVKNKRILLINTGYLKKRFIVQRLKKLGVQVIAVNKEKNWAVPYVDDWIVTDTDNHDLTLRRVGEYLKNHQVDGVITFWEDDVLLTSKIADKFGLISIPYAVAKNVRNKLAFRQFCTDHNLPAPKFIEVDTLENLKNTIKGFVFPLVVKPAFGSSSAYVIKANNYDELKRIVAFVKSNLSTQVESALHEGNKILIEEYIEGDEVDLDILIQNGKIKFYSISDNLSTKEPFFLETGYLLPTTLSASTQQELIDMAELVLEKLGVMNGCIHFEAKSSPRGPIPIEVNLRMGGDEIYPSVKQVWQVDLIEKAILIATGEYLAPIKQPLKPRTYVAGESLSATKSGVVASLSLPKIFPKDLRVQEFHFYKEVGDSVFAPPDEYEFLGWITVNGDNHNDARDNLTSALQEIEYDIVPFSGLSAIGKTERSSPFQAAYLKTNYKGRARIEKIRHLDLRNQRHLKIGVAYNGAEEINESSYLPTDGTAIAEALTERGYQTTLIDFNNLNQAAEVLKKGQVDLVFNVGEKINNSTQLEPHIASFLDAFQIPYTGSNPFTLSLAIDKIKVKKLLAYHNIPTANWDYAYDLADEIRTDLTYPLIVKPGNADNAIGINNEAIVNNSRELKERVEYVLVKLNRPVLVEEYLAGDEYEVSIMGSEDDDLTVLPLSRTIYDNLPPEYWHIYPFAFRSPEREKFFKHLRVERPPRKVSKKLLSLISEMALDTYNILDCHDYGRVEIKLDREHNPHIIELNPNPSLNRTDCLPEQAKLVGLNYGDLLERIIASCIKRYQNRPPYYHLQGTGL